jgi:hypothetical protein
VIWVIVFAAIAVAGLLMLVGYGVWLAHKASDVFAELRVLADRGGRIAETLSRIEVPADLTDPGVSARSAEREGAGREGAGHRVDADHNATRYAARRAADDVR